MAEDNTTRKPSAAQDLPAEPCAFCLEPLDPASLLLPCGHAFHSVCALQFLLKKRQCISCRAPVDESRVIDLSHLPEASGRQFVPLPGATQQGKQQQKQQQGKTAAASPGRIELQAVSGSAAAAAAAAASGGRQDAHGEGGAVQHSRNNTWVSPIGSLAATQSEGGGASGPGANNWQPDIFLVPPRSPQRQLAIIVEGGSPGPAAAAAAAAAGTWGGVAGEAGAAGTASQPSHTIRVVRPQPPWVRPLLIAVLILVIVAVVVVVPALLSRSESSSRTRFDRRSTAEREYDCWMCLWSSAPGTYCDICEGLLD